MSAVITELQASCPQLYQLVQQLGCTPRNARDGCLPDEELKGVMAVCTLLNARSARVKGLQLMISLMLVARATGRQVHVHTCRVRTRVHKSYMHTHIYTVHILHASGHQSCGCMHELHCHMGPFAICRHGAGLSHEC